MQNQKALTLFDTTVGKKAALAVSGVILFGFVIGHMLGNLQVLLGPEVFNGYAEGIKHNALLLWGTRAVLLVALIVLHLAAALKHQFVDRWRGSARMPPFTSHGEPVAIGQGSER